MCSVVLQRPLSIALGTGGATRAIVDGSVTMPGVEIEVTSAARLPPVFRRMVRETAFDVCEMALTTYVCAQAHGKDLIALPVFPVRGFHHGAILTRPEGPVGDPRALERCRVGVNRGYTVTTGVWARAILQQDYGVDLDRITWVTTDDEHVAEYEPPANVVPAPSGGDLAAMVSSGLLAAAVGLGAAAPLVPLIPDPIGAALARLRKDSFFPINHVIVVREALIAEQPKLVPALLTMFESAKQAYLGWLSAADEAELTPSDRINRLAMAELGDPLPYGVELNRDILLQLLDQIARQHIVDQPPALEALFAGDIPNTVQ